MTDTIRISRLSRTFLRGESEVLALRGIDLTIAPGEFVALVGPSGSGKSTLLNLLGGLDTPTTGELWLDGQALHLADEKMRTRHRRERVGFVFQSFNLLPRLTALENVALPLMVAGVPKAERKARAVAMLERVGLGHRLHHYPTELSGGEQQRTAVARALVHNPSLVLADEPTGNLDSVTGAEVMALLKELNREQGITLVLVTHDPEVAAYADRIVRLRDGQIEAVERQRDFVPAEDGGETAVSRSYHRFQFRDMVKTAVRNLGRRRVRNVLTAGGVLIGIITLVAMVSFGVGVQKEVQRNFESVGLENIFVSPRLAEPDEFDPFGRPEPETPITPDIVAQIQAMPEVVAVTPELFLPSGMDVSLQVEDDWMPVFVERSFDNFRFGFGNSTEMAAGRNLAENGESGAVLLAGLADRLLADGETYDDLLGREIVLQVKLPRGETELFPTTVVGVRNGFGSRSLNLGLQERLAIKAWWFGQPDILETEGYDQVVVQTTGLGVVTAVSQAITDMGLDAESLQAILEVANQVLSLMQALLGSVGGLALLVAALGVANTMMMAIYERTREIGVLKAIGASPGEIRLLFTVEAALIGFIGGVFGLILGTLLGRLVDWIGHQFLINEGLTGIGQLSVVPLWLAVGSVLFATLIGLLAGLYPAARAARLDPIVALRHE